jgi:hypothetical protein
MRGSLGRAQRACIQMLRVLLIPDIKACAIHTYDLSE